MQLQQYRRGRATLWSRWFVNGSCCTLFVWQRQGQSLLYTSTVHISTNNTE